MAAGGWKHHEDTSSWRLDLQLVEPPDEVELDEAESSVVISCASSSRSIQLPDALDVSCQLRCQWDKARCKLTVIASPLIPAGHESPTPGQQEQHASDATPLDAEHEALHASLELSEIDGCGKGYTARCVIEAGEIVLVERSLPSLSSEQQVEGQQGLLRIDASSAAQLAKVLKVQK